METPNYSTGKVLSFLFSSTRPYWGALGFASFLSVISHIVWLYNVYAFSLIVTFLTTYTKGASLESLYTVLIIWTAAALIRSVAGYFATYITVSRAEMANLETEERAIRHIAKLDIHWHEKENSGNKIKKIQRGSYSIVNLLRLWISTGIDIIVNIGGAILIIVKIDVMLGIFLLLYQVSYFSISHTLRKPGIKAMSEANDHDEKISGLYYEVIGNIRTVKVLGLTDYVLANIRSKAEVLVAAIRRRILWFQASGRIPAAYDMFARVAFVGYISIGIVQGTYDVGFLVLFFGYFSLISSTVGQLAQVIQDFSAAKVNAGRLIEMLDEKVAIDDTTGKQEFPQDWQTLAISDLSFGYGDSHVLKDIDITIKRGEKIGIVGLSGAGKSTLFKLLLKEYEGYSGSIKFDDTELKDIARNSYISYVAPVLQETEVFNMSLKENIIMTNPSQENNVDLYNHTLKTAHINDFIAKLPQGDQTLIGEKGVKLSGGERQRLGIARAVFKQPHILFLDEATSHLDIESEQKIQDSLAHFFNEVTAIVIAHRLSTIKEMDRIIVLEHGKVIESGSFNELMARSSRFKEFWEKQQKNA